MGLETISSKQRARTVRSHVDMGVPVEDGTLDFDFKVWLELTPLERREAKICRRTGCSG